MTNQLSIAHIVNPCITLPDSDLLIAQPITFESMRQAKQAAEGKVRVTIYSAQFPEDHPVVPEFMIRLPDLTQHMEHTGRNGRARKLPLLKEILDRAYNEACDADYLIYTNVDIALQPNFYLAVKERIEQGYDAFVINRRTISNRFKSPDELDQMYTDRGERHLGFDCFVFKRGYYPDFLLTGIAIGIPPVARVLLLNMVVFSRQFNVFRDDFLTFHLGNEGQWLHLDTVSPAELNNRRKAFEYMFRLLCRGHSLKKKILVLTGILTTIRYGNPWLKRIRRFVVPSQ